MDWLIVWYDGSMILLTFISNGWNGYGLHKDGFWENSHSFSDNPFLAHSFPSGFYCRVKNVYKGKPPLTWKYLNIYFERISKLYTEKYTNISFIGQKYFSED